MFRTSDILNKFCDWRMAIAAGVLGFAIALATMEIIGAYSVSLTSQSIA